MKKYLTGKEWLLVSIFIAAKLMLHFFTSTNYDLHRDTFLYYALSEELDWGYASVPPLIGIIAKISVLLFGHSAFALNIFPAIAGGISIYIIALIVKELGGKSLGLIISCMAFLLSPAYLRSNSLMQPVSFDQLFWLLSAYFIVRLLKSQDTRYWIWIFITWGVGFMNKYLISAYAISFVAALLISRERKLLFSRHFLTGSLLAFLIILPNIIWQYTHNWPVIHHLTELHQNQLVNVSMLGFLIDQLIMNFPAMIVWITGLVVFLVHKAERRYIVLPVATLFVILFLLLLHGKSYYTLGAYTLLMAMGGYAIEKYFSKAFRIVTIVLVFLLSIPVMPYSLPLLSLSAMKEYSAPMAEFTNRWEDGKKHPLPQDYSDMTGWKELSDIVISTYNSLPSDKKKNCAIYAENYGQAGAVWFYGYKYQIPRPISFSDNFLLWAPDSLTSENLIYINDEIGDIRFLFNKYEKKGEVNNPYFREDGVQVYFCSEPADTFKNFYKHKVYELKSTYRRE